MSELIAIIAVGPWNLDNRTATRRKAMNRIERCITAIHALSTLSCDPELAVPEGPTAIPTALRDELADIGFDVDQDDLAAWTMILDLDPLMLVTELDQVWQGDIYPDVTCRSYRDRRIIVAGDQTQGDAPDGDGYHILRACQRMGLFKIYNIK